MPINKNHKTSKHNKTRSLKYITRRIQCGGNPSKLKNIAKKVATAHFKLKHVTPILREEIKKKIKLYNSGLTYSGYNENHKIREELKKYDTQKISTLITHPNIHIIPQHDRTGKIIKYIFAVRTNNNYRPINENDLKLMFSETNVLNYE